MYNALLNQLYRLIDLLKTLVASQNAPTAQGRRIYEKAHTLIGKDASPRNLVSSDVACAESVSSILSSMFADCTTVVTGTYTLYQNLLNSRYFARVPSAQPGDIIISPTGLGGFNGIKNGHVGIVGENEVVMSNNSLNGLWETYFTLKTWDNRYKLAGKYPVIFFRRII